MTTKPHAHSVSARIARVTTASLLAAGIVAGGAVLPDSAITSTASAAPAAVATAPVQPLPVDGRWIDLPGVKNVRDLGGLRTTDGRVVRTGMLYRAAKLQHIAPEGVDQLHQRGVTLNIDLRRDFERQLQPDPVLPGIRYQVHDVMGANNIITSAVLQAAYFEFVNNTVDRIELASALRDILHNDGATLYHCTAGKDRTGWLSVILLRILGVDRADVDQDFLLSNEGHHTTEMDPFNGVNMGWLNTSYYEAWRNYGTFDNYVRDGLGITDDEVAQLKAKFLAPAA